MVKWEYMYAKTDISIQELNLLGKMNWEVIAVITDFGSSKILLKRRTTK